MDSFSRSGGKGIIGTATARATKSGLDARRGWSGGLLFLAIGLVLFVVMAVGGTVGSGDHVHPRYEGPRWLQGWAQWDSGWYTAIADGGYTWVTGQQSTVAFFPAYPLVIRAVSVVVDSAYVAGILVTVLSGLAVAVLFLRWAGERLPPAAAWAGLLLLLLYPYAFYLFGAVYPSALFLAAALGAFLLLEHDHPWLAGVSGAVATAAGPIGLALVGGLVARALERRHRAGDVRLAWRDAGVLVSLLGLLGYCFYLWRRFDDPLLFATAQEAWGQGAGPRTWFKVRFFEDLSTLRPSLAAIGYLAHPVLTIAGLALVPRVFRRLGWGYGAYALLILGMSCLGTKNFFGMARYVMAAFPCFAVAGELLVERPRIAAAAYAIGGVGLVVLTVTFGRSYYLS